MQRSKSRKHSSSVAGKSIYEHRYIWRDELIGEGGKKAIRRRVRRLEKFSWKKEQLSD